jgi:hypothetical protein
MNCNFDLILKSACNGRRKSCEVQKIYCPSQKNSQEVFNLEHYLRSLLKRLWPVLLKEITLWGHSWSHCCPSGLKNRGVHASAEATETENLVKWKCWNGSPHWTPWPLEVDVENPTWEEPIGGENRVTEFSSRSLRPSLMRVHWCYSLHQLVLPMLDFLQ